MYEYKIKKLQEFSNQIENGLDYDGLISLRKKVYNIKTEMYSEEWYEKQSLLKCLKEFIDESKPTIEQEEQKIFKEFEELGYRIFAIENYNICLYKYYENYDEDYAIIIDLKKKCYYCECMDVVIDIKIHQLLHKLFELWGWFE